MRRRNLTPYEANLADMGTPFMQAGLLHDDRLVLAKQSAQRGWHAFYFAMTLAILAVCGVMVFAFRVQVYPFIVEVENGKRVRSIGLLTNPGIIVTDEIKGYLLREWLINVRSLSTDPRLMKKNLEDAWLFTNGRASQVIVPHLNELGTKSKIPDYDAQRETISITITSIMPVSDWTYHALWEETRRNRNNQAIQVEQWAATLTLHQVPWNPSMVPDARTERYPLGVFLHDVNWERKSSRKPTDPDR